MKKFFVLFLASIMLNLNTTVFAKIVVPTDTEIIIAPVEKVTSNNPKSTIKARIVEDVIIDGTVIFRSGDKASFNVADFEKSSYLGVAGNLEVYNGVVYDTKGTRHKVLVNEKFYGKNRIWVQVVSSLSLTIILFPLALFAFIHGSEAKVTPSTELNTVLQSSFEY